MNKFSVLAAIGCVSAHNIDLFNPANLANMGQHSLVKQMLETTSLLAITDAANGSVTFTQCDDDTGAFTLDTDATKSDPDPIVKGTDVALEMHGIVSDSIEVKNVHIHVDWNGSTLYDEDHAQDNTYDSDLEYNLSWSVPSFAPSGAYDVHVKAYGDDGTTVLYCVDAQMTL